GQLLTVEPAEFGLVCDALEPYREQLRRELWSVALAPGHDPGRRLRAACALARFDPENAQWGELVPGVAKQLANENPLHVPFWLDALQAPVRDWLIAPLADLCKNRQLTEVERAVATTILAGCACGRPARGLREAVRALVAQDRGPPRACDRNLASGTRKGTLGGEKT